MELALAWIVIFVPLLGHTNAWTTYYPEDVTSGTTTTTEPTSPPLPTYPPIPNPYMQIELLGEMTASYSLTISCTNEYSKQFTQVVRGQLQRAKQEMLATSTFCPGTTTADLTTAYVNMVAAGTQVYLAYGVEIVSYGANTLEAMSTCAWQLGAYLSDFNNWRQPIFTDIFNCPRITFQQNYFNQTSIDWVC